jgi:iron complex outermembrane receptor protein
MQNIHSLRASIALAILILTLIDTSCIADAAERSTLSLEQHSTLSLEQLSALSLEELSNVKIVTPSKRLQNISDAPATTYSISANTILKRGYRNLVQLLEDIPEVQIDGRGFSETYNLVSVRGISGIEKGFIILQDGIRISAITGSPTENQWNYPLQQAKRVEVVLSPASALYGADATNGIINIITKDADDLKGGNVTLSGGMYSTTDDSAIYGKKFGDVSIVGYGSFYSSSEPYFPDLYPVDYAWYNNQYLPYGHMINRAGNVTTIPIEPYSIPTRAYALGAKVDFKDFELGYFRNYGRHSTSIGARPERFVYTDDTKFEAVLEALYGRYTYAPEGANYSLKAEFIKGAQGTLPESAYRDFNTDYVDLYLYEVDNSDTFNGEFSYDFSELTHLISGISYTDYSTLPRVSGLTSPYDPKKGTGSQGLTFKDTNIELDYYALWYQNFGVFTQLQKKLGDKNELTLGARYDYNSRYGGSLNPRIGSVFEINPKLKAKLLYGEAFRAPPPWLAYARFGLFTFTGDVPTGGNFNVPNPNLKPEKLRTIEGSLDYKLSDSLFITTDLFFNILTDAFYILGPLPAGYTFHGVPITGVQTINKGVVHTYGGTIKVDSTQQFGKFQFNPFLSYTYTNGDIDTNPLVNFAPSTIKGGIDVLRGHLSASSQFQFRSRTLVPNTTISTPSYFVMNFSSRYENLFNTDKNKLSVFLNIRNLLNRRYYNANVNNAFYLALTPQDPLRAELGATLEL